MDSITNPKDPDPSISPATQATPFLLFLEAADPDLSSPLHGPAWPELTFKTLDNDEDVIVGVDVDSLKCFSSSDVEFDDDLFSIFIDVKKLDEKEDNDGGVENDILQKGGGFVAGGGVCRGRRKGRKEKIKNNGITKTQPRKQRHRRAQKGCLLNGTSLVEPRKAMAAEELAELWAVDPKRAKRYKHFCFAASPKHIITTTSIK